MIQCLPAGHRSVLPWLLAVGAAVLVVGGSRIDAQAANGTQTYTGGGEYVFTVPAGVTSVQVQLIGAPGIRALGQGALGGRGALVTATLTVTPGQLLFAEVGGGFDDTAVGPEHPVFNGGGAGGGSESGGGGGAADVRLCSSGANTSQNPGSCSGVQSIASRLVVAGGGGGGGGQTQNQALGGAGGDAGTTGAAGGGGDGVTDGVGHTPGSGGGGATTSAGGDAGANSQSGAASTAGALGQGGAGGDTELGSTAGAGGGGGGGGLYGGGGGGGGLDSNGNTPSPGGGGGGGGTSGIPAGVSSVGNYSVTLAATGTHASVVFTWILPAPTVSTGAVGAISTTTAVLTGAVNPNGTQVSDCHFDVSPGGIQVPCVQQLGGGSSPLAVSGTATGLTPGTAYTATLSATSAQGTASGGGVGFSTTTSGTTTGTTTTGSVSTVTVTTTVKGHTTTHVTTVHVTTTRTTTTHTTTTHTTTGSGHPGGKPAPVVKLSSFRQSASRWRLGPNLVQMHAARSVARKPKIPVGTTFSFALNRAAAVTFRFSRLVWGRTAGSVCRPPSKRTVHGHPCKHWVVAGRLRFQGHKGTDTVAFEGFLTTSRKLRPGRYTVRATAVAARHRSSGSLVFTALHG